VSERPQRISEIDKEELRTRTRTHSPARLALSAPCAFEPGGNQFWSFRDPIVEMPNSAFDTVNNVLGGTREQLALGGGKVYNPHP
jgi:hypothetical protein